jgi:histidinol-phosphatase
MMLPEIDFARRVAVMAGENALRIRRGGIVAEAKADDSPVTIADRDNERLIREAIELEFPNDGILGEEGSSKPGTSGRRWIVDPIDGTRDFVRANRFWCILIALEEHSESCAGVAHFPLLGETYWAVRGQGSWLNDDRLRVSSISTIDAAVFCPNGMHTAPAGQYASLVMDLSHRVWAVRSFGGALDACLLAAGKTDVWFEPKVEPWDLAALKLIIEEAGGRFLTMDGSRSIYAGNALACTPALEQEVRQAFGVS